MIPATSNDLNFAALIKEESGEKYIFCYTDSESREAIRTCGRFASNSELSFNWYDAAVLCQKIRQDKEAKETAGTRHKGRRW